jgi:hypothetical protein
MSCKCMKLASRSARLSLSSANWGSRASRAVEAEGLVEWVYEADWELRREEREEGRRGVVGREMGERERGRWVDMLLDGLLEP